MTPRQKLRVLQRAIERAELGKTKIIHCPYCEADLDFSPPSILTEDWQPPTCCAEFALATIAILQRKEMNEARTLADSIRERAGGQPVFN